MATRSSLAVLILAFVALFSLLYYSETFGQQVPLVSHSTPKITKEQAVDIAESFLKSQVSNVTRIRTQQDLLAEHGYDGKAPNEVFLAYFSDKNGTAYLLDSTHYTPRGTCPNCIVGNKEFKHVLAGHMFYFIELYYDYDHRISYAGIYVDAINSKILYPPQISP